MVLSLMSAALADCTEPVTAQRISQMISLGEAAYQNMDEAEFRRAFATVQSSLPCVSTPFNTAQTTSFWRMHALAAFLDRDEDAGIIAFQSVLASTPGYSLSESLAPMGHPLQTWLESALVAPASLESVLATPSSGSIFIDGTAGLSAAAGPVAVSGIMLGEEVGTAVLTLLAQRVSRTIGVQRLPWPHCGRRTACLLRTPAPFQVSK